MKLFYIFSTIIFLSLVQLNIEILNSNKDIKIFYCEETNLLNLPACEKIQYEMNKYDLIPFEKSWYE